MTRYEEMSRGAREAMSMDDVTHALDVWSNGGPANQIAGMLLVMAVERDEAVGNLAAAHAKIALLRQAMGPFARCGTRIVDEAADAWTIGHVGQNLISVGDLRRARTAYEETK